MAGHNNVSNEATRVVEGVVVRHPGAQTSQPDAPPHPDIIESTATPVETPRIHPERLTETPMFSQPSHGTAQRGGRLPNLPRPEDVVRTAPTTAPSMRAPGHSQPIIQRAPRNATAATPPLKAEGVIAERPRRTQHRALSSVLALLALGGVAGGGVWLFGHSTDSAHRQSSPKAEEALIPGLIAPDNQPTIDTPTPTPTESLLQILGTPTETLPTTAKPKTQPSLSRRKIVIPRAPVTLSSSPAATAAPTPRPAVSTPNSTPTPTPTPATTSPETTPPTNIAVMPDRASLRLISAATDKERVGQLKDQYGGVDEFLHADLGFLNSDVMQAYQANIKDVYANSTASNTLQYPQWLDEAKLQDLQATGTSPAGTLNSHTHNVLQHANELFSVVGGKISQLAYLNSDYSSRLTDQLNAGEDVAEPARTDEAIIGKVQQVNGVAVVPVDSTYLNKDSQTVNVVDWEALVPIDNTGRFIGVVALEQTLTPTDTATPTETPSPSTTATDPQSTPASSDNAAANEHRHGKSHKFFD